MSKISRRGLFGLGAGAAAVPFVKPEPPKDAEPWTVTVFHADDNYTFPAPQKVHIVAVGGGGGGVGGYVVPAAKGGKR